MSQSKQAIRRQMVAVQGVRMAGQRGRHRVPPADLKIADDRHAHGAGQQQHGLDALGPHDGQQAADHRIEPREHAQHDDEEHRGAQAEHGGLRGDAQNAAEHPGGRVQGDSHVDDNGGNERNDRQPVAAGAIETPFEEVGQCRHPRTQIERGEKEREQDQREAGHPFEVAAVAQPVGIGRLGQADQMDRGDVGGEHGQADHRPGERVAGEEVMAALAAPAALGSGPAPQPHDGNQIDQDHREVDPGYLQRHEALPALSHVVLFGVATWRASPLATRSRLPGKWTSVGHVIYNPNPTR